MIGLESELGRVHAFQILGEDYFNQDSVSSILEEVVCKDHAKNSKITKVSELRYEVFRAKNLEVELKYPRTYPWILNTTHRARELQKWSQESSTTQSAFTTGEKVLLLQLSVWSFLNQRQAWSWSNVRVARNA